MMLIRCPWCGPRDEDEFHYGGQAGVRYPDAPQEVSDEDWAGFLFYRDNPRGVFTERWSHACGCRRWFVVHRDTRTNRVESTHTLTAAREVRT